MQDTNCLDILIVSSTLSGGSLLGSTSSGNTARSVTRDVRAVDGKVDVLLTVSADKEGRNVNDLLADADVALTDEDASVVDGLSQVQLEDLGLEAALHEDLSGELEDIIKRVLILSHETIALEAADERRSLEESLGVLGIQSEESSGSLRRNNTAAP